MSCVTTAWSSHGHALNSHSNTTGKERNIGKTCPEVQHTLYNRESKQAEHLSLQTKPWQIVLNSWWTFWRKNKSTLLEQLCIVRLRKTVESCSDISKFSWKTQPISQMKHREHLKTCSLECIIQIHWKSIKTEIQPLYFNMVAHVESYLLQLLSEWGSTSRMCDK